VQGVHNFNSSPKFHKEGRWDGGSIGGWNQGWLGLIQSARLAPLPSSSPPPFSVEWRVPGAFRWPGLALHHGWRSRNA